MMDSPKKVKKENNSKLKIIPGMCCSVDPKNELKAKETGVTHVIAVRRIKKKPFRNSIWQVRDFDAADNAPMMEIEEFRLWPENMSLIRYPDDMPAINGADMEAFDKLLKFIDELPKICEGLIGEKECRRLKALHAKLKYYYEMRDV